MKVAIYVRKSKFIDTSESIINQIKMCKDKIKNKYPNEKIEFFKFEDEGYSGATINRPNFQRLMDDIKSYDILVCYRLDRISRNVADFAQTWEILKSNECQFISVTESFDTTSPLGEAMIYIASVFAQLERVTTAERIRDNMLILAKNGKWSGGNYPLGLDGVKSKYIDDNGVERQCTKLVINNSEIETVKLIYNTYLNVGSLSGTVNYLIQNNIKNKKGSFYDMSSLRKILENPVYCRVDQNVIDFLHNQNLQIFGEPDGIHSFLSYNKTHSIIKDGKKTKINNPKTEWIVARSTIEGIFNADYWLKVQNQLNINSDSVPNHTKKHTALLSGKVYCNQCKHRMIVRNGKKLKSGIQNYDYTCTLKRNSKSQLCSAPNINTILLDNAIISEIKNLWPSRESIISSIKIKNSNDKKINPKIEISKLNNLIVEKQKKISRFLDVIGENDDLQDEFLNKIRTLKSEINELKIKIESLNNTNTSNKINEFNIELVEEMLKKCNSIDSMSKKEQEDLIRFLIDSVYVDKSSGNVIINFIGFDKKE
ncbi:recombinase family protein [uncultured Clostridium sp.]|jgi:site-specific DNA recombinase|uniref:recombinase family protein n=1 Tax=uncultured Clostridium sp. TaxID=59620 RepID=UPI00262924A0|nr:recombinase family protein [uncultured Clostridium sp.]